MSYINLETYYRLIFALVQFHKWDANFIENLLPYEREIYTSLLNNHLQEEEEKAKNNQNK